MNLSLGNDTDTHGECMEPEPLGYFHWVNFIFITIVALIGLISQFVVLTVLWKIKKKTSTDIFLFALSILDVFVIVTLSLTENGSIYLHILKPGRQFVNAGYISVATHPLEHMAHFASTWCIVLMSLDRYISICHTRRARSWCTARRAKQQVITLVVIVTIYSIPRFFEYYPVFQNIEKWIGKCDAEVHLFPEGSLGTNMIYIWVYTFGCYLLFMYLVPLSMISFFNYHLIKMIKNRINFHNNRNQQILSPATVKKLSIIAMDEVSSSEGASENSPEYIASSLKFHSHNSNKASTKALVIHSNNKENGQEVTDHKASDSNLNEPANTIHTSAENGNSDRNSSGDISQQVSENSTNSSSCTGSASILALERSQNYHIQRQYDHVIRMLITVTLVFSICQVPDIVQQLISRIGYWPFSEEFGIVAYDFIIINSSINLFIYTATSKRFKKMLMKTFKCFCQKYRVNPLRGGSSEEHT